MKKIKVQIKGKEKFIIKLLKGLKIDIYDIKYINEKSIYLINFDDLKKIPKSLILSQSDTLKDRLFRHKEFIISIITGIVLIIFLSHIIVNVKIMNNDKNIRTIMQKELKKYGVKPFTIRKKYEDLKQIKKQIISDYKNIFEWIEIEPRGMVYIVRIEKRIITKEKRKDYYCDIISTKDAIIRSIESFNGQNRLYVNDYVLKGETIISGDIISNEEVKSKVCADGTVIGNTWYNVNIKYPRYHMKKIYTKKKSYNIGFSYNNKSIKSVFKVHYKKYDLNNKLIIKIGKLKIYKQVSLEYKIKRVKSSIKRSKDEALNLANKRLIESLKSKPRIISRKVLQSYEYNSIINMDIFYSVDEVISKQQIKDVNKKEEEG